MFKDSAGNKDDFAERVHRESAWPGIFVADIVAEIMFSEVMQRLGLLFQLRVEEESQHHSSAIVSSAIRTNLADAEEQNHAGVPEAGKTLRQKSTGSSADTAMPAASRQDRFLCPRTLLQGTIRLPLRGSGARAQGAPAASREMFRAGQL
jgi:hypothetical protein